MNRLGFLIATLALLTGCSTTQTVTGEKAPRVFKISTRRLPPQPTYSRLRWANLESLPSRELPSSGSAPMLSPVIQFEARNTKLDEAAKMLAATAQYSSYCASTIATQKITLNRLGTIDELGEAISRQAGIKVVVDHEGRSVRFFPQQTETPQFYGSAAGETR